MLPCLVAMLPILLLPVLILAEEQKNTILADDILLQRMNQSVEKTPEVTGCVSVNDGNYQ
jgi:hypothetical protein